MKPYPRNRSAKQPVCGITRREFVRSTALGAGAVWLGGQTADVLASAPGSARGLVYPQPVDFNPLDLAPAKWIWYPADRTLPNTVILFRSSVTLDAKPKSARGWSLGESRYRLEVNGRRVQWGPAPNDPRWPECDPVDLTGFLWHSSGLSGETGSDSTQRGRRWTRCELSSGSYRFEAGR